ncbi:tryptophan 2,3-dioxygenase [Streptomyces anulatus]|uniref:tryptophan 2,3-dioxygenase n=1 Tax=Streptomyces anulatus TaxID=1892 RepID=UPI0021511D46|nr:tryptophan 2,3-dioxygenase family protein [Streptomyces anulatus]WSU32339.1 tryptophan 2,3-dioxygenase family protein [Streptomyces anulatus]WSW86253.1 tryptophan 2,3-dioxygenase family protein [Streptomyces anulatus]
MTASRPGAAPADPVGASCPYVGGDPAGPATATAYAEYARMDDLLALQHPQTGAATEPGFIIMSQVMELLFELLRTEFTTCRDRLAADDVDGALWTLRRSARVQQVALSSWDFFSAMTPGEFAEFRDVLGSASGFQSASYRRLEFLLGNKNPGMVEPHRHASSHGPVRRQLSEPSLYDAALALLHRRGLPVPVAVLNRPPEEPYTPDSRVEDAWRTVYADPVRYRDLHLLGEALTDAAESFARWRYTHLAVVQRVLGGKPGTGGTDGVAWLDRISGHRFFPELWSVRSVL